MSYQAARRHHTVLHFLSRPVLTSPSCRTVIWDLTRRSFPMRHLLHLHSSLPRAALASRGSGTRFCKQQREADARFDAVCPKRISMSVRAWPHVAIFVGLHGFIPLGGAARLDVLSRMVACVECSCSHSDGRRPCTLLRNAASIACCAGIEQLCHEVVRAGALTNARSATLTNSTLGHRHSLTSRRAARARRCSACGSALSALQRVQHLDAPATR
jgi:hypothetical protein